MEIPVLVHGKGIYDSDAMKMKYTGMILEGSRIKEMSSFEELGPAYPGARVMDFRTAMSAGSGQYPRTSGVYACRDTYGIYRREDRKTRLARAVEHAGTSALRRHNGPGRRKLHGADRSSAGQGCRRKPGQSCPRIQAAGMPLTPDGGHLAFLGKTSNGTEGLIQAVKERKSAAAAASS